MSRHENYNTHGYTDEELFSTLQSNSYFSGPYMDEITINLQGECEKKPHPAMIEECKQNYTIEKNNNIQLSQA